jgi:hypothetical protein
MQTVNRAASFQLTLLLLFVILFVFFTYTFLHETGHAITGLVFGQSLTEFDVSFWDFSAHVNMVGGTLTQTQLALQSVSGASLPLLVWALFINLIPRTTTFIVGALKLISSITVINTLVPWMVIPVLFLYGNAPSDDVTNFLRYSQIPPLSVMLAAFLLYIGGCLLLVAKTDGMSNQVLLFRDVAPETLKIGTRSSIPLMTGVMALCVILAFVFNASAVSSSLDRFSAPEGYVLVARIDLSIRAYSSHVLTEFSLDEPDYADIFVMVQNINTSYFDLSVLGPDGYNSTVLHGEGYNADQDGGLWEEHLRTGTYQIVLTSHRSPGTASIYLKSP